MEGTVKGFPVVAAAFNFMFLGGSMGSVVGEKFVRGVKLAIEKKCHLSALQQVVVLECRNHCSH